MPTKTIHLIRHGQSLFNAAFDAVARTDPMLFDAPLSPTGREQAAALRAEAHGLGVEIIVTSPLTRAIETTLAVFGADHAPIHVEALHCERVEHSCDVGRSPRELADAFPGLAFHHLDDPWWHSDGSRRARDRGRAGADPARPGRALPRLARGAPGTRRRGGRARHVPAPPHRPPFPQLRAAAIEL